MRNTAVIAFALLFATIIGGCVAPEDAAREDPEAPDEQETFDGFPPPRDGSIELPHALYPTFQGRDCESVVLAPVVPWDDLREHVPEDFRLVGPAPGVLARVFLIVDKCSDTLDNSTVFGETHMVSTQASVIPVNESWSEENLGHAYILDVATDNQDWLDSLERAYLSSEPATFSLTMHEVLGDTFTVDVEIEGQGWEVSAIIHNIEDDPSSRDYQIHLWYGDGPYHRMTESTAFNRIGHTGGGFFLHEGNTTLALSNPASVFPYDAGSWSFNKDVLFQYDGAWENEAET